MTSVTAIIPARLASTRFPGKVLAADTGRPLIQHVCDAARRAQRVQRVVVATDAPEVIEAVARFEGEAVLTSPDHPNGSSRLAEAATALGLGPDDIVVNVQGDEPEVDPAVIDAGVEALERGTEPVSTLASPIRSEAEAADPNVVKVVRDRAGRALYFSRARIPHDRDGLADEAAGTLRHIGLYCYRAGFLRQYATLDETPLERTERLEQLRVLEHGFPIAVVVVDAPHTGIDTPEQYRAFVARWNAR